jgi:arabinofuranosyltransferase
VLGGLAVLTRMDSAVLVATAVIVHLVAQHRATAQPADGAADGDGGDDGRRRSALETLVLSAAQIGLPAVLVVAPWLLWKLDFYGSVVPNTFYAKSAANPIVPFLFGILYLLCFFASYAAFLLIGRWRRFGRELFAVPGPGQVLALVPVWFLYVCVVGADFMEFRFLVPVLPLLALVAAFLVDRFTSVRRQVLLVGTLLAFSAAHAVAPTVLPYPVLTFKEISHWPSQSPTAWKAMGDLLAETFPGGIDEPGQPVVAVAPLGVISYYSDLPTIDMLGLTDEFVARDGDAVDLYYPGHVRMAPVHYLRERDVNLVVGQPRTVPVEPDRTSYRLSELVFLWPTADLNELPDEATVIEVPLTPDTVWLVILLETNPKVDDAIAANGWRVLPIERTCDDDDLGGTFERLAVGDATCPEER